MSQSVKITATGKYPRELPQPFKEALAEQIRKHMDGYGVTESHVEVESTDVEPESAA